MAERWLLVAARAPARHGRALWDDAAALAASGAEVTLLMTDDTTSEVATADSPAPRLAADGVRVVVDRAAAARRGLLGRFGSASGGDVQLLDRGAIAALLLDPDLRTVWR